LEITDPLGRIIHQKEISFSAGNNKVGINTAVWSPGVYLLKAKIGTEELKRNLVKE
jgi:hypothetical protein